jgi:structural maintenance of chromosome 4
VKKETAKLVKDLASHEKEEVKLQEKKKHVSSKQKKLKKAIADVRVLSSTNSSY